MEKLFSLLAQKRRMRFASCLAAVLSFSAVPSKPETTKPDIPEINTILMESTFRIHGPKRGEAGKFAYGTGFLMGKPTKLPDRLYYVFVTAAHVLDDIAGDDGVLTIRKKLADESYKKEPWRIKLRKGQTPLYVKHPYVDVAALYVDMPDDLGVSILPDSLLATDDALKRFAVHPGDELLCLGYPLFVSSDAGFPILRSGKLASYPLVPTKAHKQFLFDSTVFEGNSGGPVYFVDRHRYYDKRTHLGEVIQMVVGLVSAQVLAPAHNKQAISVASVVPSPYIAETIKLLPEESPYK